MIDMLIRLKLFIVSQTNKIVYCIHYLLMTGKLKLKLEMVKFLMLSLYSALHGN